MEKKGKKHRTRESDRQEKTRMKNERDGMEKGSKGLKKEDGDEKVGVIKEKGRRDTAKDKRKQDDEKTKKENRD